MLGLCVEAMCRSSSVAWSMLKNTSLVFWVRVSAWRNKSDSKTGWISTLNISYVLYLLLDPKTEMFHPKTKQTFIFNNFYKRYHKCRMTNNVGATPPGVHFIKLKLLFCQFWTPILAFKIPKIGRLKCFFFGI